MIEDGRGGEVTARDCGGRPGWCGIAGDCGYCRGRRRTVGEGTSDVS